MILVMLAETRKKFSQIRWFCRSEMAAPLQALLLSASGLSWHPCSDSRVQIWLSGSEGS